MRYLLLALTFFAPAAASAQTIATGIKNPESVAVGGDGRIYVTSIGEFDKEGDGAVFVLAKGKLTPFVTGLDDPKGIASYQKWLFVADRDRVYRIDLTGKKEEYTSVKRFPTPPVALNDVVVDPESGTVFVADSGSKDHKGGAVYRLKNLAMKVTFPTKGKPLVKIDPKLLKPNVQVTTVTDQKAWPDLKRPNGLAMDGANHLLLTDSGTGKLHRIALASGKHEDVADGFGHADGIAWDYFGRLFISDWAGGRVFVIPRPGEKPLLLKDGFKTAADICHHPDGKILVPDMKAGTVTELKATAPGWEVDDTPLPLKTAVAFPDLKWTDWYPETDAGKPNPLRLLFLTHAGDGSNRVFVTVQQGVIHVFPNDQKAKETKVFLDISKQVVYRDNENEQGLLGLAFHPKFKTNGEFFVFYSTNKTKQKYTSVLSRFRVSKDDPNRADPTSEEELLRIDRPFWNHDGGTIAFGPDGYLYVALGDGGAANDPFNNAQNLKTLLGSILRLDIDRKSDSKSYAIPKDNPFVGKSDALPEIYAYGLRNVWRMAFDRKTGQLWAGEVGQNLYEEINLIVPGGNYGWKLREAMHPFFPQGVTQPRKDLIEPIWEYHHDLGKSITGGTVYRGKLLPMLDGAYLYTDYISDKIWALRYDEKKGRVVANQPIADPKIPILSFGEDENGEVYFLTVSLSGRGIYRFVNAEK